MGILERDLLDAMVFLGVLDLGFPEGKPKQKKFSDGLPSLERVIFNPPATIAFWNDGVKTIVKCHKEDTYDKEKGIALCYMKRMFGNDGSFNEVLKKFVGEK